MSEKNSNTFKKELGYFLKGGFASVVPLLREFHFDKTHIVLDGLHFSAYSLLIHMYERQKDLLNFMKDPDKNHEIWKEAIWPKNYKPESEEVWKKTITDFEKDLLDMVALVKNNSTSIFEIQQNGKSLYWAACTNFQHNAYHIGQLKTIGRQLGVW